MGFDGSSRYPTGTTPAQRAGSNGRPRGAAATEHLQETILSNTGDYALISISPPSPIRPAAATQDRPVNEFVIARPAVDDHVAERTAAKLRPDRPCDLQDDFFNRNFHSGHSIRQPHASNRSETMGGKSGTKPTRSCRKRSFGGRHSFRRWRMANPLVDLQTVLVAQMAPQGIKAASGEIKQVDMCPSCLAWTRAC